MIHAVLHHGWIDVEKFEACRQRLLTTYAGPAPSTAPSAAKRKSAWSTLAAGSPAMALLRFLDSFQREHGQMPSVNEITRLHPGISSAGHACYCLSALESGGWIAREFGVARGIAITPAGRAALEENLVSA